MKVRRPWAGRGDANGSAGSGNGILRGGRWPIGRSDRQVSGFVARCLRRFDVDRSPGLAQQSRFLGLLTPKRSKVRAPTIRQIVDAQLPDGRITKFLVNADK